MIGYGNYCFGYQSTFTAFLNSDMYLTFQGGVLMRDYQYDNFDDFSSCESAAADFQYIFAGENPPPGQVNSVSPPRGVIP